MKYVNAQLLKREVNLNKGETFNNLECNITQQAKPFKN